MAKQKTETGPIYGVELLKELRLDGGIIQAMPTRHDLESARLRSERAVAGFEVLTAHYRRSTEENERLRNVIRGVIRGDDWSPTTLQESIGDLND